MVGRDADLVTLMDAAERARRGAVTFVLVTGEAGIGKSRLVSEFAAVLKDATVLVSHGVAMSTGEIPFGVLADLLKSLLRVDPAGLTDHERDALAPLLPGTRHGGDRTAMLSAALDLVERLSTDRLLVWIVEDLQWADAASRDLLGIALRTAQGRLLVVATMRTDEPGHDDEHAVTGELDRLPGSETVRLRPLSLADVRRQLAGLDLALDTGSRRRIEQLSGGIPFVVEELAATGGMPRQNSQLVVSRKRLDGLPPDAARLVEAAAIGDGHLRLDLLEQVTDLAGDELDLALKAATAAGVLEEHSSHDELAFRHPLFARRSTPRSRRAPGGAGIAVGPRSSRRIPASLRLSPAAIAIAQHWARTSDTGKTVDAAVRAALAAGELDLHEVEADMWERVIELWDGVTPLPGLETYNRREIRRFWRWAVGQVDADRYLELVRRGVRDADDASTRACMEFSLLVHEGTAIDTDADPRALARFEERARTGPRDAVLAVFLNNLAEIYLNDGDRDRAHALAQESAQIFAERGDTRDAMRARSFLALIEVLDGSPERGIEQLEALLAQSGDRVYARRWVGNVLMMVHTMVGNADAANATFDLVATTLDTRLDWPTYEQQLTVIMRSWLDTGRWERAVQGVRRAAAQLGRQARDLRSARRPTAVDAGRPGRGSRVLGRPPGSRHHPWRRRSRVGGPDRSPGGGCRGRPAADAGAPRAGVGHRPPPVQRPRAARVPVDGGPGLHPDRGGRRGRLGWAAWTRRRAARAPPTAPLPGSTWRRSRPLPAGCTATARWVPLGAPSSTPSRLGSGATKVRSGCSKPPQPPGGRSVTGYDAAICELDLAEALATLGERDAAREAAESALATARSLGAVPVARRAGAVLHRLGSPGRSDGLLTRRELDVIALVSAGRTNNQIAKELFISPKTAGIHVSRIIAKLGAANRTEAAAIGRRTGLIPGES